MANAFARARFFVKRAKRKQLLGVLVARKESMEMVKKKREVLARELWRGDVPNEGYFSGTSPALRVPVRLVLTGWPEGTQDEAPRLVVEKHEKDATGGDRWAAWSNVPQRVFERTCAEAFDELTKLTKDLDARMSKLEHKPRKGKR